MHTKVTVGYDKMNIPVVAFHENLIIHDLQMWFELPLCRYFWRTSQPFCDGCIAGGGVPSIYLACELAVYVVQSMPCGNSSI